MRALLLLCLLAFNAFAQTPPPGLRYRDSARMTPVPGSGALLVQNTTEQPSASCDPNSDTLVGGSCGSFRTVCKPSHMGPDDPLINPPGSVNASHLHTFMGAIDTSGVTVIDTDPTTLTVNSTCRGGTANKSRYWFPTMIDVRSGRPIAPFFGLHDGVNVYYKTGVQMPHRINAIPAGFRMIAGNSSSTAQQPLTIQSRCIKGATNPPDGGIYYDLQAQPFCGVDNYLRWIVTFPQCVALDGQSPNGTLSGAFANWSFVPSSWTIAYVESTSLTGNVTDVTVSGGGGAAAPVVEVSRQGTGSLRERHGIRFASITNGQSVTVAGRTFTCSIATCTAEKIIEALQGGAPLIDSPNHKDHVAYGHPTDPKVGCPSTHPYAIPHIQVEPAYLTTSASQQKAMRLSSDIHKGAGGLSGHGDFRMGWDQTLHRKWVQGCDRTGMDCHSHLLGCKNADGTDGQCQKISF